MAHSVATFPLAVDGHVTSNSAPCWPVLVVGTESPCCAIHKDARKAPQATPSAGVILSVWSKERALQLCQCFASDTIRLPRHQWVTITAGTPRCMGSTIHGSSLHRPALHALPALQQHSSSPPYSFSTHMPQKRQQCKTQSPAACTK